MRRVLERGQGKTICPSEVARALCGGEDEWRALMPRVREVAAELVSEGLIVVTQKSIAVDPQKAKGPVRLGLAHYGVSR